MDPYFLIPDKYKKDVKTVVNYGKKAAVNKVSQAKGYIQEKKDAVVDTVTDYAKTGYTYVTTAKKEVETRVQEIRNEAIDITADTIIYVQEKAPEIAGQVKDRAIEYTEVATNWGKENLTPENIKEAIKDINHKVNGVVMFNPYLTTITNRVQDGIIDGLYDASTDIIDTTKPYINASVDFIVKGNEVVCDAAGNVLQGIATIPALSTKALNEYYLAKQKLASIDGEDVLETIDIATAPAKALFDYAEDVIVNGVDSVKQFCEDNGITYDNAMDAIEFTQAKFENMPTIGQFGEKLEEYLYKKADDASWAIADGILWGQGVLNNTVDTIENKYENIVDNIQDFIANPTLTYDFSNIPSKEELKEKGLSVLDYLQGKTVDGINKAKGEVIAITDAAIDELNGVYQEVLTIPAYLKDKIDEGTGKLFNNGIVNMFIPTADELVDFANLFIPPTNKTVLEDIIGLVVDKDGNYFKGNLSSADGILNLVDKIMLNGINGVINEVSIVAPAETPNNSSSNPPTDNPTDDPELCSECGKNPCECPLLVCGICGKNPCECSNNPDNPTDEELCASCGFPLAYDPDPKLCSECGTVKCVTCYGNGTCVIHGDMCADCYIADSHTNCVVSSR